jgi:WD40 repeat protein
VLRPASEEKGQLAIRLIAFAPDGNTLVYADVKEQRIHFWNVQNRTESQSIPAKAAALALSPDGSVLAWLDQTDESFTLRLVKRSQPDQPQTIMKLPSSTEAIFGGTGLFFSPDGQQLVLGGLVTMDDNNAIYVISLK